MYEQLSLYHIFQAVAESGNISQAAKTLYISQPAVSKSIHKLEEELGTVLFVRTSRGVLLTEEGKILYEHTKQAFSLLDQGKRQLELRKSKETGELRIGASTTLCKYILLPLLKNFIREHPNIRVSIHCQSTFETMHLLEEGKVDLGLTGIFQKGKNKLQNKFYFQKYCDVHDIFVTTDTYLKSAKMPHDNTFSLLHDGNLMLLDEDNISRIFIDEYFQKHGFETNHVLEVSTMDLLIEFAKIGLGTACVIREFILDDLTNNFLTEITLPEPIPKRSVGFAFRKSGINQNSIELFLDYL